MGWVVCVDEVSKLLLLPFSLHSVSNFPEEFRKAIFWLQNLQAFDFFEDTSFVFQHLVRGQNTSPLKRGVHMRVTLLSIGSVRCSGVNQRSGLYCSGSRRVFMTNTSKASLKK